MNNLKNAIAFLFFFLTVIFGIAQVRYIEDNVLNFEPAFFVLVTLAVVTGIFSPSTFRLSIYNFLLGWTFLYVLTWFFYWKVHVPPLSLQILGIQFLLVEISAGLAFDVGRQIAVLNNLFEGLSASTYPNRTFEIAAAGDRISAELTRSRRYHHPLSLLIVELQKVRTKEEQIRFDNLQKDLLRRFAIAKVGQIISDRARETDLILREQTGRFLVICPETDYENSVVFAERIGRAVNENMGAGIVWSSASFPDEALTFDELLERAEQRLSSPGEIVAATEKAPMNTDNFMDEKKLDGG
jgi:GGDEF domain-containing protein